MSTGTSREQFVRIQKNWPSGRPQFFLPRVSSSTSDTIAPLLLWTANRSRLKLRSSGFPSLSCWPPVELFVNARRTVLEPAASGTCKTTLWRASQDSAVTSNSPLVSENGVSNLVIPLNSSRSSSGQ